MSPRRSDSSISKKFLGKVILPTARQSSDLSILTSSSSDRGSWKKITQMTSKELAISFFRENGAGNGIIKLPQKNDIPNLKSAIQGTPKVGETLRLGMLRGEGAVFAIPNLEKGGLLDQAGITAEDIEYLNANPDTSSLDEAKQRAISRYWDEIATVANHIDLFDSSSDAISDMQMLRLRSKAQSLNAKLASNDTSPTLPMSSYGVASARSISSGRLTSTNSTVFTDHLTESTKVHPPYIQQNLLGTGVGRDKETTLTTATPEQILNLLEELERDFIEYQSSIKKLKQRGIRREDKGELRGTKHELEDSVCINSTVGTLGFKHRKGRQEMFKVLNLTNGVIGQEINRRIEQQQEVPIDELSHSEIDELNDLISAWNKYLDLADKLKNPECKINIKKLKADISMLPDSNHFTKIEPIQQEAPAEMVNDNPSFFTRFSTGLSTSLIDYYFRGKKNEEST